MTEHLPLGLLHLAGEEAESLWNEYLYGAECDPEAFGIVVDFTQDPALFDE